MYQGPWKDGKGHTQMLFNSGARTSAGLTIFSFFFFYLWCRCTEIEDKHLENFIVIWQFFYIWV